MNRVIARRGHLRERSSGLDQAMVVRRARTIEPVAGEVRVRYSVAPVIDRVADPDASRVDAKLAVSDAVVRQET